VPVLLWPAGSHDECAHGSVEVAEEPSLGFPLLRGQLEVPFDGLGADSDGVEELEVLIL
jgi:hypothetical protein